MDSMNTLAQIGGAPCIIREGLHKYLLDVRANAKL